MKRIITNLGILQIFAAMLLIIVIMFSSVYVIYKKSISAIYGNINENNTLQIRSIVSEFDNNFRTINNFVYIANRFPNSEITGFDSDSIDMVKAYHLHENISSLISSTDYIEDLIMFFDQSDLVISSKGTAKFSHLFNNKYRHPIYNDHYWRTVSLAKKSLRIYPVEKFNVLGQYSARSEKDLMILLSNNQIVKSDKHVMVIIDAESFLNQVDQRLLVPGSSLIILDENRNPLLNTGEEIDLVNILNDLYFNKDQEMSVKRGEYEYNLYKSEYNDYIYINRIPYQFQNINEVLQANTSTVVIATISTIILSFILSIYLYRPVKRIIHQLGGESNKGNDLRKIHRGIIKLQRDYALQSNELERTSYKALKSVLLEAIAQDSHPYEWKKENLDYELALFKQKPFFIMVLVQAYIRVGQLIEKDSQEDDSYIDLSHLNIKLQQRFERDYAASTTFHVGHNEWIVVVGVDEKTRRQSIFRCLKLIASEYEDDDKLNYDLVFTMSKLHTSNLFHCKDAYQDIVTGINYRAIHDRDLMIDTETFAYKWHVYFPLDKLDRVSNLLMTNELSKGKEIIQEILLENFKRNIHHTHLIKLMNAIYFYMFRHWEVSERVNMKLYSVESQFLKRIEQAQSYDDYEQALFAVAEFVADQSARVETNTLDPVAISQYIAKHYMDELYLDHMAEIFQTTAKYFSNYFKRTFGVNYVDYLNNVRLSHAKQYLIETNLTIAEIGEKVGYANPSTFATTFRRFFGISPSEYRKK